MDHWFDVCALWLKMLIADFRNVKLFLKTNNALQAWLQVNAMKINVNTVKSILSSDGHKRCFESTTIYRAVIA